MNRHWRRRVRTPGGGVELVDCTPEEDENMERIEDTVARFVGAGIIAVGLLGIVGVFVLLAKLWRMVAS